MADINGGIRHHEGKRGLTFLTVTFPAGTDILDARDALRKLTNGKHFRPRGGPAALYFWVLEKTKRGTPHYHMVLWAPWIPPMPRVPDRCSKARHVARLNARQRRFLDHVEGCGFGWVVNNEPVRRRNVVGSYLAKYLSKQGKGFEYPVVTVATARNRDERALTYRQARRYGASYGFRPAPKRPLPLVRSHAGKLFNGYGDVLSMRGELVSETVHNEAWAAAQARADAARLCAADMHAIHAVLWWRSRSANRVTTWHHGGRVYRRREVERFDLNVWGQLMLLLGFETPHGEAISIRWVEERVIPAWQCASNVG